MCLKVVTDHIQKNICLKSLMRFISVIEMVAAEPDSQITFLDFNQKSESLFKVWSRKLRLVFIHFSWFYKLRILVIVDDELSLAIEWGVSSSWSLSLYCSMRNFDRSARCSPRKHNPSGIYWNHYQANYQKSRSFWSIRRNWQRYKTSYNCESEKKRMNLCFSSLNICLFVPILLIFVG